MQQVREVRLYGTYPLRDLDHDGTFLKGHLIALLKVVAAGPVKVAEEISRNIVDHDTLVESVVAQEAILPSLLLSPEVVRVQAVEFMDRGSILSLRDREVWRTTQDCCRHDPRWWSGRSIVVSVIA